MIQPGHLFQLFTQADHVTAPEIDGFFKEIRLPQILEEGQIWDLRMLYQQGSITIAENSTEPILLPDLPQYAHWDLSRYGTEGIVQAVIPPVCGDDEHPLRSEISPAIAGWTIWILRFFPAIGTEPIASSRISAMGWIWILTALWAWRNWDEWPNNG